MIEIETKTANRLARNLEAFAKILRESQYARAITGIDSAKIEQIEIDIQNLKYPKK
jgi:hypothetical protein